MLNLDQHFYILFVLVTSALTSKEIEATWAVGLNGYESLSKFFQHVKSLHSIGRRENAIPSLIIAASDDGLIHNCKPSDPMPKNVIYAEIACGGHGAFGTFDFGWVNSALVNYFLHFSQK